MGLRNTSLSPAEASASAAVALVFLGSRFVVPFCLPPAHQLLFVCVTSAVEFVVWPSTSTLAFFLARAPAKWLFRLLQMLLMDCKALSLGEPSGAGAGGPEYGTQANPAGWLRRVNAARWGGGGAARPAAQRRLRQARSASQGA
jgi:hypothetical protein